LAGPLLRHLRSKGLRRLGIVKTEHVFFNSLVDGMRVGLAAGESMEIIDTFQFIDNDFRSALSRLKAGRYDAVGVFLVSGQVSQFYRQAAALHMDTPTFGTDFFESQTEIGQAGPLINGAFFPAIDVSESFKREYREKYGNDLQVSHAGHAYDFAMLLAQALRPQDILDWNPAEFLRHVKKLGLQHGVTGDFQYMDEADGGGFEFPIKMKIIKDQKVESVSE
jgi:ABC-type branched-subunit amino acid transport system substrate-binding protein